MSEHVNLDVCPFCGSNKVKITSISKGSNKGSYYQGLCNVCHARGPKTSDYDSAVNKWNKTNTDYFRNSVDKAQLNEFIRGNIVLRCDSFYKMRVLLNELVGIVENVESIGDWDFLWYDYKDTTVVSAKSSIVDRDKAWLGYCDYMYYKSKGCVIEDIILR